MGKNILIIVGSPKAKSSSNILADAFIEGASKNAHNITKVELSKVNIEGCTGCNLCFTRGRPCVKNDDMDIVYDAFAKADLIIFSTPVYYFALPSQLKAVLDRFYAIGRKSGYNYPARDVMLFAVCGDESGASVKHAVNYYKLLTGEHFKWLNRGVITACGITETTDIITSPAFKNVEQIGRDYL
jgi:multimeric flavodoxin WrbA